MANIQDRRDKVFATTGNLTCHTFPREGENCIRIDLEVTPTAEAGKLNLVVVAFAGDAYLRTPVDEHPLGRVELRNAVQHLTGGYPSSQPLCLAIAVQPCFRTLMEKLKSTRDIDNHVIALKDCSMATMLQDEKTGQMQDILYTQVGPLSVKL